MSRPLSLCIDEKINTLNPKPYTPAPERPHAGGGEHIYVVHGREGVTSSEALPRWGGRGCSSWQQHSTAAVCLCTCSLTATRCTRSMPYKRLQWQYAANGPRSSRRDPERVQRLPRC